MQLDETVLAVNDLIQRLRCNTVQAKDNLQLFAILHYQLSCIRNSLLMPGARQRIPDIRKQLIQLAADASYAAGCIDSYAAYFKETTVASG